MNQSKTDNSIAKIKTSLETMNRINDIEKQINDLEVIRNNMFSYILQERLFVSLVSTVSCLSFH